MRKAKRALVQGVKEAFGRLAVEAVAIDNPDKAPASVGCMRAVDPSCRTNDTK